MQCLQKQDMAHGVLWLFVCIIFFFSSRPLVRWTGSVMSELESVCRPAGLEM